MFTLPRRLAELVRILQERHFVFIVDPEPITESLRTVSGDAESKLIRRAELIDADHSLQDTLSRVAKTFSLIWWAATLFWLISGFLGMFTLMQQSGLNFFLVLAAILGWHTLSLLIWLLTILFIGGPKQGRLTDPTFWLRGKSPVRQAVARLYTDMLQQPSMKWQLSAATHRLWLAALIGMLVSALLLLSVRQYTFNWESTLLSDQTFVTLVAVLSKLPGWLGFPVPDSEAVLGSRLVENIANARQWGGLLVGSILCYGILPRLAAWLFCSLMAKRYIPILPLDKPYYQRIIQQWQTKIIDADTQRESLQTASIAIHLSEHAEKWAVIIDGSWPHESWYRHILGQDWHDRGMIESREQVAALNEALSQVPVQLLIGVRAQAIPDRGLLRKIVALADAAKAGAIIQLLLPSDAIDAQNNHLSLWHDALTQHHLAWLDPPQISQSRQIEQSNQVH